MVVLVRIYKVVKKLDTSEDLWISTRSYGECRSNLHTIQNFLKVSKCWQTFLSDISEKQKSENSVEKIYIFRIEYFMHANITVTFVTDHIWLDHLLIINVNLMVFLLCSGDVPSLFWVLKTLDFNLKLVVARTNKFTLQLIGLLIKPMGVYAWPDLTGQHKKKEQLSLQQVAVSSD